MSLVAVVDDEPLICDLMAEYFKEGGCQVRSATTAILGLKLIIADHFDLAVIDVEMPGISGLALAEVAANLNTPVLLMTGHPEAAWRAHELGLMCLLKPFNLEQLSRQSDLAIAQAGQTIQSIKDGMARLSANVESLSEAMATSKRLMEKNRELLAKAVMPAFPAWSEGRGSRR